MFTYLFLYLMWDFILYIYIYIYKLLYIFIFMYIHMYILFSYVDIIYTCVWLRYLCNLYFQLFTRWWCMFPLAKGTTHKQAWRNRLDWQLATYITTSVHTSYLVDSMSRRALQISAHSSDPSLWSHGCMRGSSSSTFSSSRSCLALATRRLKHKCNWAMFCI